MVRELVRRLEQGVRRAVPSDRPVALVGVGDGDRYERAVDWVGAEQILRTCGIRVGYRATTDTFDSRSLSRAVGAAPILTIGALPDGLEQSGGALSDVLRGLHGPHSIVRLPYSIDSRPSLCSPAPAAVAGPVRDVHRQTHLVRDQAGVEALRIQGSRGWLTPDLGFGIGPLIPRQPPCTDVVCVVRPPADAGPDGGLAVPGGRRAMVVEGVPSGPPGPGSDVGFRLAQVTHHLGHDVARRGRLGRRWPVVAASFGPDARGRVRSQIRLLSLGRVVITNRRDTQLLAVLLGIPSVLVAPSGDRAGRTLDSWTSAHPLVSRTATWAESWYLVDRMMALAPR